MSMTLIYGGQRAEWALAPVTRINAGRTKLDVLTARLDELKRIVEEGEHYLEGLKNTNTSGIVCECGTELPTEHDFAAHFVVTDERHLNLGGCPILDGRKS